MAALASGFMDGIRHCNIQASTKESFRPVLMVALGAMGAMHAWLALREEWFKTHCPCLVEFIEHAHRRLFALVGAIRLGHFSDIIPSGGSTLAENIAETECAILLEELSPLPERLGQWWQLLGAEDSNMYKQTTEAAIHFLEQLHEMTSLDIVAQISRVLQEHKSTCTAAALSS